MKFEIDLNKLNDDELELIVEMKKKRLLNQVDERVKESKREILLKELSSDEEEDSKKQYVPYKHKMNPHKAYERRDWKQLGKEAREIIRSSDEPLSVSGLYRQIRFIKSNTSGKDNKILREEIEKDMDGIKKVGNSYVSSESNKKKRSGYVKKGKRIDWEAFGDKARRVIKESNESLSLSEVYVKTRGLTTLNTSSSQLKRLRVELNKRMHGIRKVNDRYIGSSATKKQIGIKYVKKGFDKSRKRLSFMHQRAKHLANSTGIGYEEAFRRASLEWGEGRTNLKDEIKPSFDLSEFPKIESVGVGFKQILVSMLDRVIKEKSSMSFSNTEYPLGINTTEEWNKFVEEIIGKSIDISNYFKVPNKFFVFISGKYKTIGYRG